MSTDPTLPPDNTPQPERPPLGSPVTPVSTPATSSGLAPNVAAGLAVLFNLIGGIVFLIIEKRNQFVRFWAMQAVIFGAALFVFCILATIISLVFGFISPKLAVLWGLLVSLAYLGLMVVWVIMLVQAFSGKEWELPMLGKIARKQLGKLPTV